MTFAPRVAVLMLAAFGAANLLFSAGLLFNWRRVASSTHAPTIVALRSMPAALSALVVLLAGLALAFFEPRGDETTGTMFLVFAAFGAACLLRMAFVAARGQLRARRIVRRWMTSPAPITLPGATIPVVAVTSAFPIVAVVGLWRPRMIIGRSVVAACSARELAAIAAHEQEHVSARHNLSRMWLAAMPDAVSWLLVGHRIAGQWNLAAERQADDASARAGATGHLDLASALVRVARLAPAGVSPMDVPVSALFRGESPEKSIDQRVRRLLDRGKTTIDPRPLRRALLAAGAGFAAALLNLRLIHEILEVAVEHLP